MVPDNNEYIADLFHLFQISHSQQIWGRFFVTHPLSRLKKKTVWKKKTLAEAFLTFATVCVSKEKFPLISKCWWDIAANLCGSENAKFMAIGRGDKCYANCCWWWLSINLAIMNRNQRQRIEYQTFLWQCWCKFSLFPIESLFCIQRILMVTYTDFAKYLCKLHVNIHWCKMTLFLQISWSNIMIDSVG